MMNTSVSGLPSRQEGFCRSLAAARIHGLSLLLGLALASTWSLAAHAQAQPAGTVKTAIEGTAVSSEGRERALQTGDAVYVGDTLRTGPAGSLAVTMRDETRIALSPRSTLKVSSFAYDAKEQQGNMTLSVVRGISAFVSGVMSKKSPGSVRVVTPTMTAGIRGTEYIVEVSGGRDE